MNMIRKFGSHSVGPSASAEKAISNLVRNEAQSGACHLQKAMEDGCKKNEGHGQVNIQRMKGAGELGESCKESNIKETSLKYSNQNADVVVGNIQSHEKCKNLAQKVAPVDKLWDGYLKLNPSTTVSAIAFYKSGEKMPDVKWSEFVEVKGRVKLVDFENYVQDVRRSPNRGLMVVSLCWKEGSSKYGPMEMKKVAETYKESERVGLAKLLPGIDLYVCPRSDKIITLLAKHGFYNGKRAIEVNKDSLIGCVVWKKNQVNRSSSALVSVGPEMSNSDSKYQRVSVRGQSSKSEICFGNSSGLISPAPANRASDSLTAGKERSDKGFRHMDGSLPRTMPNRKSWPTPYKRRLENFSHQEVLSDDDTHNMCSQHKKVCRNDNISNLPLVIGGESRDMRRPYSTPVATPARSLFVDDDMPEWRRLDVNPEKQPIPMTRQFSDYPTHPAAAQNHFSREYAGTDQPPFHVRTPQIVFNGPVFISSHALSRPLDRMFESMVNPLSVTPVTSAAPSGLYQSFFTPQPRNLPSSQTPDGSHIGNVLTSSMGMNCDQPFRSNSYPDNRELPINREVRKKQRS